MTSTKSFTRFTVAGSRYYDTAAEAVAEARRMVYFDDKAACRAIADLLGGKETTIVYGFCSVTISPPALSVDDVDPADLAFVYHQARNSG